MTKGKTKGKAKAKRKPDLVEAIQEAHRQAIVGTEAMIQQNGSRALGRISEILEESPARDEWGRIDPTYRAVLDLALKAARPLREKVDVDAKHDHTIRVIRSTSAPGALTKDD